MIEDYILNGKIVPVEITIQLLKDAMEKSLHPSTSGVEPKSQFLIDGFPRNLDNLHGWKKIIGPTGTKLLFVLYFECSEAVMRTRILSRGEQGSGRIDDNETAIKKRFDTYLNESKPVIDRYAATGRAVIIDANKSTEEVWQKVKEVFSKIDFNTQPLPKIIVD